MRKIYLVVKGRYSRAPLMAFTSKDDAIEVAKSFHEDEDGEAYVYDIPLVDGEKE